MFKPHNVVIAVWILFIALLLGGSTTALLASASYLGGVKSGIEEEAAARLGDRIKAKAKELFKPLFH